MLPLNYVTQDLHLCVISGRFILLMNINYKPPFTQCIILEYFASLKSEPLIKRIKEN